MFGLRAGLTKVVVVPTDEEARRKVEWELARGGLLMEGRVQVR
jgi:hypothetical protein